MQSWASAGCSVYRCEADDERTRAISDDGQNWEKAGRVPLHNPDLPGQVSAVNAHTVGKRIHIWLTDQYDEGTGVGLFLFDPTRLTEEGE